MRDFRLVIPAAAGWIAAAVWVALPSIPAAITLWAVAGACTALAWRWRTLTIIALAAAAAALCCTSIAAHSPGRVLDEGASRFVATTTQTVLPGQRFEARIGEAPVLVFVEASEQRLGIGTVVALSGRLVAAEPGDDVAYLLFAEAPPEMLDRPPWILDWANGLRERFVAASSALAGAGGDLLAGLAIGDTSAVDESLDAAMTTSSLTHLTAVSGANCAIVIGLIMAVGAAAGLPRGVRIVASVAVLVGFVVLVTPEPSVLRAAVMAALVLAALGMGRPVSGVPVLSLATLSLLVIDPWLSRSFGFVLSVLATAGLLVLAGPLARALERWLPPWLALVLAIPISAQLACQPVILLLDATLPTYGVAANLLAAPAAPLATIVGLAGCLVLALSPPIGFALCQLAWLPSAWIAAVAQFFAGLPGARLPWPAGVVGVVLLVAASALALVALFTRRRAAVLALTALVVAYTTLAGGSRIATQLGRPDWQIAACDVGQGDAVLVRNAGQVALIDTGPEPAPLTACLDDLGIARLDLLVLTHFDLDHVGGVRAVVGRADRVLVGPSAEPADGRIVADLVAAGADVERPTRGTHGLLGDLRWSVLWPTTRAPGFEPGNDLSITLLFEPAAQCSCISSAFLGDLGESSQRAVLAAHPRLPAVEVVKVAHHGSADQHEPLYERLRAAVGVISVGADNGYGHPTDALLSILGRAGTAAVRTDEHGLVLLAAGSAPGAVTVWTAR